ncbi:hypothetical protein [Neobacillus sp. D3-1R]|uniref:hypothetical protein n=1 Tax=Neobacillus sp. D3-1R TaxID=3445778 RepID=UPI003F9FEF0D
MKIGDKKMFLYIPNVGFINGEEPVDNIVKKMEQVLIEKGFEEDKIAGLLTGVWEFGLYED